MTSDRDQQASTLRDQQASALGRAWGEAADRPLAPEAALQQRDQLLSRIAHERARAVGSASPGRPLGPSQNLLRFRPVTVATATAVAVAAASLLWFGLPRSSGDAGSDYVVVAPDGIASSVLEANADPVGTRFADGSTLQLAPGGRARILTAQGKPATAVLERGTLNAVTKEEQALASIQAGPYLIASQGSEQEISWDPVTTELSLLVKTGSARVTASNGTSLVVVAGQRLSANAKAETHSVQSGASGALGSSFGRAAPDNDASPSKQTDPSRGSSRSSPSDDSAPSDGALHFRDLLSQGKFQEVVTSAKKYGLTRCYSSCSADDLRALADAARYIGDLSLADRALTSLSQRPGAPASTQFHLGRLHEGASPSQALTYYERYLKSEPGGSYAAEALAGKIRALTSLGRTSEARASAQQYLRQFPSGVHAQKAQALLSSPP